VSGLYNDPRITAKYFIKVIQQDYKKDQLVKISAGEFKTGKVIRLERDTALKVIIAVPRMSIRNYLGHCLDELINAYVSSGESFFVFISNTNNPLIATDADEGSQVIQRIPELFDDEPNVLNYDFPVISDRFSTLNIKGQKKITLMFYMPSVLFRGDGGLFINKIIQELLSDIYNFTNTEVFIFTDSDEDRPGPDNPPPVNYYYYNILKE
jgi:hypothetical protein